MKRTVIYARYSSQNQTEQSIEGQIRVCTEYAERKNLTIIGEYIDRAISGKTDNRPEFQHLIADCRKGLFDAVVVYRTDRFARNKYDSAIYKRELKRANIELHYAAEPIPDGPEGIILESLMEGLAEYYSAELSQKIRRGKHESALKLKFNGGTVPLGYKITEDKNFEIEEVGAKAVQLIFMLFLQGKTYTEIICKLNEHGYSNRNFNASSIKNIIKNEIYIGIYKCGKVIEKDVIPAIIEKDIFYLAQNELDKRRTSKQYILPKAEYLLSGKVFCGICGSKMIGVSGSGKNGKRYYYYYCKKAKGKNKTCSQKNAKRDWLENLVFEATKEHVLKSDMIHYLSEKIIKLQAETPKDNDIAIYTKQLRQINKSIQNTLAAIESGVTTSTLPQRLHDLEIERAAVNDALKKAESEIPELTTEHITFFLSQFIDANMREIINLFVCQVWLYEDKIVISYHIDNDGDGLSTAEIVFEQSEERLRGWLIKTELVRG